MARSASPITLTSQEPAFSWDVAARRMGEATAILLEAKRRRDEREQAIRESQQVSAPASPKALGL